MPRNPPYRPKSRAEIYRNMSAIRATENRTEVALRSILHRLGLRFRKYAAGLPGRPDIVFPRAKVAVFVDGDFWHARTMRERGTTYFKRTLRAPSAGYWLAKFTRRIERDGEVNLALRSAGWRVLRFWESEVKADVHEVARRIASHVDERT